MVNQQFYPSYTYQTPSGYIFRLRIPGDLKAAFGKSEFRYSLKTGSIREARQRARCISALLPQVFAEVRYSDPSLASVEKVNQLVERRSRKHHERRYQQISNRR